jgi:hypothetical protein
MKKREKNLPSSLHRRWVLPWWCASDAATCRGRIGGGTGVGRTWVVVIEHRYYTSLSKLIIRNKCLILS